MDAKLIPYLRADQINQLVATLGERINHDYHTIISATHPLLCIVTLKGAFLFAADLLRELTIPVDVDFVRVSSYTGSQSSGAVRIVKDLESSVEARHVLILDEIVDTGNTLNFLLKRVRAGNPASIKVAALLDKPSRREVAVAVDYVGKKVEDKFLVGYGLDYNEQYRSLKDIYYINQ